MIFNTHTNLFLHKFTLRLKIALVGKLSLDSSIFKNVHVALYLYIFKITNSQLFYITYCFKIIIFYDLKYLGSLNSFFFQTSPYLRRIEIDLVRMDINTYVNLFRVG